MRATALAALSSSSSLPAPSCSSSPSSAFAATFATDARRLRSAKSRATSRSRASAAAAAAAEAEEAATAAPSPPREVASTSSSSVPSSSGRSDASLAAAVSHPALVVARGIEWGNVVLGFEQANKYTVLDESGRTVALLAEEDSGVGSAVARQVLRARRSFVASLLSADGSRVLARVRRPLYLVNSTTTIEDGKGNVVGEVVQRWHPLRRKYDLFIDKVQVAEIDSPLLAWEFTLTGEQERDRGRERERERERKRLQRGAERPYFSPLSPLDLDPQKKLSLLTFPADADGRPIALIDRNFSGFGKELFTDAGRYAVHFGEASKEDARVAVRRTIEAAHPEAKPAAVDSSVERALVATSPSSPSGSLVATSTGGVLALARPLAVDERLAALAAAIAIDFDYFSRHSSAGGGMGMVPFMLPMPVPSVPAPVESAPDVGGVAAGAGGGEGGEGGGAGGAASSPPGGGSEEEPLERDLGSEEAPSTWDQGGGGDDFGDNGGSDDFGPFGNGSDGGGGGDSGWGWDDGGGGGGGGGGDGEGVGGAAGGLFDLLKDIFHQD